MTRVATMKKRKMMTDCRDLSCSCWKISEEEVKRLISLYNIKTLKQFSRRCNAGTDCGSCLPVIRKYLEELKR